MAAKNPQDVANRWRDRLAASTTVIQEGVSRVTRAPTEAAAARKDKWLAGIQQAAVNGKWENGLRRVTLQDWQQAMINKGVPRIAQGASEATTDFAAFLSDFLPYADSVSAKVNAMPSVTLDQNIARAVAAIQMLAQYKRK